MVISGGAGIGHSVALTFAKHRVYVAAVDIDFASVQDTSQDRKAQNVIRVKNWHLVSGVRSDKRSLVRFAPVRVIATAHHLDLSA